MRKTEYVYDEYYDAYICPQGQMLPYSTTTKEANHHRHTQENKSIYKKRKEAIERVFADAKEKHGMRWTILRGIKKLSMQAMLTIAAMNLKKMANWNWVSPNLALKK